MGYLKHLSCETSFVEHPPNNNADLQAGICFDEAQRTMQGASKREKYRKAEYIQHHGCFVYVQSSLHENVILSVCARMGNAAYIYHVECGIPFQV